MYFIVQVNSGNSRRTICHIVNWVSQIYLRFVKAYQMLFTLSGSIINSKLPNKTSKFALSYCFYDQLVTLHMNVMFKQM